MRWIWADLHTHCAVSYGFGTAERALANAAAHLDAVSITGHAFWPDIPTDLAGNDATMLKHFGGFEKNRRFWPELSRLVAAADRDGRIVTLPSYEWHSMRYGDHNVYATAGDLPLIDAASPDALARRLADAGVDALVMPHHIGYATGWRGIDWASFDAARSPVLEIFSSHGASEADDAPRPYGENMGFRQGASTARDGLVAGHRFGFQAGTDTHDGYPGHYGHGRTGLLVREAGRAGLVEALRSRRTVASTGAHVEVDLDLGGVGIGGVAARRDALPLRAAVRGTDTIVRWDLVVGDRTGWEVRPLPVPDRSSAFAPGRHALRIETGWGRHGTISRWNVEVRVRGGEVAAATPYFRYAGHGNADPLPTEVVEATGLHRVAWRAHARSVPSGDRGGTHHTAGGPQTMHLVVDGNERTELTIESEAGAFTVALPELARRSVGRFTGGLASPALVVSRAAPEREWSLAVERSFVPPAGEGAFVYLRAVQADGQAAWASPVFLE